MELVLVDINISPHGKVSIFVDGLQPVTVDTCARISRFLESELNREEQDFELEVSSPGVDRPLVFPVQYRKNLGRMVDVLKKDGTRLRGKMTQIADDGIILERESFVKDEITGRKKKTFVHTSLKLDEVKSTKVVVCLKQ